MIELMRQRVLNMAVRGELVDQYPAEGTSKDLLKQIGVEKNVSKIETESIPHEIPSNWTWTKLKDISESISAGGDKPKKFSEKKTATNIYPVVSNGITNEGVTGYTDEPKVNKTSLTVSARGTIGYSFIRDYSYVPIVRLLVVIPTEIINIKFLKIVMDADFELGVGSTIKQLTIPMLKKKLIPLPPLEEQKRIIKKAEGIFSIINKIDEQKKDALKTIELIRKTTLQQAIKGDLVEQNENDNSASDLIKKVATESKKYFDKNRKIKILNNYNLGDEEANFVLSDGWELVDFESIIDTVGNKKNQIKSKQIQEKGAIPVVSQGKELIEGYSDEIEKIITVKEPLVLFGDHTKNVKYIDFDFIIGADGTKVFKSHLLTSKFLFYWTKYAASKIEDRGYSRHYSLLKKIPVVVPPLPEQNRIVEKIDQVMEICDQMEELLR